MYNSSQCASHPYCACRKSHVYSFTSAAKNGRKFKKCHWLFVLVHAFVPAHLLSSPALTQIPIYKHANARTPAIIFRGLSSVYFGECGLLLNKQAEEGKKTLACLIKIHANSSSHLTNRSCGRTVFPCLPQFESQRSPHSERRHL